MSPTWSLTIALVVIVGVAVAANRIMKNYIEGPKPPRDRSKNLEP